MNPVNSYTEWGKLKEVILGSHYNTQVGELDISMKMLFHDNLERARRKDPTREYTINKKYIEEREEDVTHFAELLLAFGICVRRPQRLETVTAFTTPYWNAITKACDNPRDQVLIVGNRIIETSCCVRNRYFENDLFKPIFYDYFRQGARWICAPRPTMQDEAFDPAYIDKTPILPDSRFEMMFDAAQCLRFGKDILMNVTTYNHELGFQWLARELGDEFRLHKVALVDNHLDGGIMPLRPGKLLICHKVQDKLHLLPDPLKKWDILYLEDEDLSRYLPEDLLLASERITVNVLSLDERHVVINEHATRTIKTLEKHGFTPIPIRFRHSRIFGGGIHCASLDICRDETLEDYFS